LKKQLRTDDLKKKIDKLFLVFNELKELSEQSKLELSNIDKELSNQYHKIEGADIDYMSDSHMLIIKLKDILWQRRDAKINHTLLESIVTLLNSSVSKANKRTEDIVKRHDALIQEIIKRAK
tara:strand:+ start:7132 stop:7497 length:366 start_codon:yes stop_codon:yes gene_type:complete